MPAVNQATNSVYLKRKRYQGLFLVELGCMKWWTRLGCIADKLSRHEPKGSFLTFHHIYIYIYNENLLLTLLFYMAVQRGHYHHKRANQKLIIQVVSCLTAGCGHFLHIPLIFMFISSNIAV